MSDVDRSGTKRDWLRPDVPRARAAKPGGGRRANDGDDLHDPPSRRARDDEERERSKRPADRGRSAPEHGGSRQDGREPHGDKPERKEADKGEHKPDGDDGKAKGGKDGGKPKKPAPKWPFALAAVVVLGFVGVVLWIVFAPRPDVWTDDATVTVHYAVVSPRIAGRVVSVPVDDDQVVKGGDLLALLDPRDNETAVATAQAQVERDTAQTGDVQANVERQPSLIDQSSAEVDSAKARLALAQADARRFDNLASTGAGTGQQRQQAEAQLQQAQASLRGAQAQVDAAQKQLDVLKQQKRASDAALRADRAQLDQAKLNLGYTRVLAPLDGVVAERAVQVGNYVAPGATLMALVPLQDAYVEANYREVDLLHVRAGQHATVHVDAYNIDLDGVVNGVPAASGAAFAPIAPSNATGNFTKVVQRLPVRIDIAPNQPLAKLLRVGFSVETTIHTGLADVVAEQGRDPHAVTGR